MLLALAGLDYLLLSICSIAFACNAKNFAIVCAVFFLLFFFLLVFDGPPKVFLLTFHHLFPKNRVAKIKLISLNTLKKTCVKFILLVVIRDACGT